MSGNTHGTVEYNAFERPVHDKAGKQLLAVLMYSIEHHRWSESIAGQSSVQPGCPAWFEGEGTACHLVPPDLD